MYRRQPHPIMILWYMFWQPWQSSWNC